MIKLPLEALLEAGFAELGVEFGRRVYGEEVAAGASVADSLGDYTLEEYRRSLDAARANPEKHFTEAIMLLSRLTDEQKYFIDAPREPCACPPFFSRNSGDVRGWSIKYVVYAELRVCFEYEADRLIAEGKANHHYLQIFYENISNSAVVMDRCDDELYEITVEGPPDGVLIPKQEELAALELLDGKQCSPEEVNQAVMAFLRAE